MPQKLFIPYIGSVVVLTEDWTFDLFFEIRNHPLIKALYSGPPLDLTPVPGDHAWSAKWREKAHGTHPEDWYEDARYRIEKAMTEKELAETTRTHRYLRRNDTPYISATLPAGTPLRCDRVYIRRGVDAYSSITWGITKECKVKSLRQKKFWAKLRDVNNIICEPI